ncbi:MAG: InlB B-repeat-containing protein [Paludibacteraceae bacterium]|nr:InlB B-repeat-containing protein [Paludibacteraceae bacterium]
MKKILFMSTAKLTSISIGLLLAVFCTIGMSFTPVEEEVVEIANDSTSVSGPQKQLKKSHWTTSSSGCTGTTYTYHNKNDYGKAVATVVGGVGGTVSLSGSTTGAQKSLTGNGTSTATLIWSTNVKSTDDSDQTGDNDAYVTAHTNEVTFTAVLTKGYTFLGWYSDSECTDQVSEDLEFTKEVIIPGGKHDKDITSEANWKSTYGDYSTQAKAYTETYYAKFEAIPTVDVTFLALPSAAYGNYVITFDETNTTVTTANVLKSLNDQVILTANPNAAYLFDYWYTEDGEGNKTILSTENPLTTSFATTTKVGAQMHLKPTHLNMVFKAVELDANDNPVGSYTVNSQTVSTSDYKYNTGSEYRFSPTMTATPAEGYMFAGWYVKEGKKKVYLSTANPWSAMFEDEVAVYADFVFNNYTDDQKAQFKVGSTYYTDLNAANAAAGSNGTIICTRDGILPPGNYTISSGVKLYIPYSTSETSQTVPKLISQSAPALSPYCKLIMVEGANINCNGTICVGGQITSMGGGNFSGYPVGACGILDMSKGGHIELNDGAVLYAWGFIKGQDMDQGNNTIGAGTITANSGAKVYEDFSGENRGGSACSALAQDGIDLKSFPFQGYTIQNIEVPVTYKFGSTLQVYTALYIRGDITKDFPLISSSGALFLLKNSKSIVTKWYDPTSDLACYQLSGTAQLDAINTNIYVSINSADFNLPISSNMHIILDDCNMTLSNPIQILPDAIIEIRDNATVTLASNLFLYDVDDWKKGVASGYFAKFNNLTSHKDRGVVSSKEMLSDAKLIVDGTLNVTGKIYSTAGGANICGNDGGKIIYPSTLASSSKIYQCWGAMGGSQTYDGVACSNTYSSLTGTKTYVHSVDVNTANLHNEDDSYTKSIASTTFYNIHGRWFTADDKDEKENHTYKFTYITSGAVSGTGGTSDWTPAVYSWDKTGLELRQKWANVTYSCEGKDENENTHYWWQGQGEQSSWFYNWTLNSDWHQFMPTATEGMYSGSNNKIYTKTDCDWEELGETDENCLYTIGGVKKALVEGEFVALEPNNNDPAYHAAEDATQYYICFEGCNWHPATKYEGENKAYIVDGNTYIWYEEHWMAVEREEPFFYTTDKTNVKVYYEYIGSDWSIAEPYIRLTDAFETRLLMRFSDAIAVASAKKNATITILRDFVNITFPMTYTASNTTCTIDLNGHTAEVQVTGDGTTAVNMLTLNGAGSTFTITDNTAEKKGELKLVTCFTTENNTKRWRGIYLQNGSLVMANGKLHVENPVPYTKSTKLGYIEAILVASGKTLTVNDGTIEAVSAYNPYGIEGASGSPTITINGGTIETVATTNDSPYAIYAYGTININGGYVRAYAKASTSSRAINLNASTSYQATLNMTGGTVEGYSKTTAYGVFVNWNYTTAKTEPNTITTPYYAKANISGGEIKATTFGGATAEAIRSYGTTKISGGTVSASPSTTTAFGIRIFTGTTTISDNAIINATATETAYGVSVSLEQPVDKTGVVYNGTLIVNGGTINATTTSKTTAYCVYVGAHSRPITTTNASNASYYAGNYANAGTATINGGVFNATAKTTGAYGVVVAAAKTESGAEGYAAATATPKCTINGGYFKSAGTGSVFPINDAALPENVKVNAGYYSHNGNLATYAVSPKQVVTLLQTDPNRPDYEYKVAEAYTVTFKNGETQLQSGYQEAGKSPVYEGDAPTKASTTTASYVFDGWSTTDGGALVSPLPALTSTGATYYAHFAETTLKYMATFDAKTNGGNEDAQVIYVEPAAGVGTLPTATKTGYTFNGWYTAASGGEKITSATVPTGDVTYFAQFTVNSYNLTWVLGDGGKVATAGKYGSTSWPAKNSTETPTTKAVPYGSALTAPVVSRTGYTFVNWGGAVAATMPAEALTYTAVWRANTDTKYTVNHYQQNTDGSSYPTEPSETEALTGTTATTVTPAVKSYDGFNSPSAQTVTIAGDGSTEVNYYYPRLVYTFTLDAYTNGGTSEVPSIEVLHGATIGAVPPDAQKGCNDFTGWYTKPVGGVKITPEFVIEYDMKTLYAQFSDDVRTYPIIYNAGANGTGTVDAGTKTCGEDATLSSSTFTRDGYTQTGWSLTDGGAQAYALGGTYTENASLTLYPVWTLVGYQINFVDEDGTTTLGDYPKTLNPGATVTAPTEPTKAQTAEYTYTFAGWSDGTNTYTSDAIPNVTAAVTYTATYTATANVASVTVGTSTTYYTTIAEAWDFVNDQTANTTIKLLQDVTSAASLVFTPAAAMTCTLDLNNHTLSGAVNKHMNINLAGSTFIIDDSSDDKNGKILAEYSVNDRLYAIYLTKGTLNLEAGHIHSKNSHTYSSAAGNKNSAATGVYVTAGQTFTMDGGTVESESQYSSIAIYSSTTGTTPITINNGLVKGHTTASTTAMGIYTYGKNLTVNGGTIIGHAWTTTAYGIYVRGGSATLNGGRIEATNDTISNKGTTTTYGVYARGPITVPAASTVEVIAKSRTNTAYAINVYSSITGNTIAGGTFTAIAKTGKTSAAIVNAGGITISGGKFTATAKKSAAYGISSSRTVTINGTPEFNVTAGTTTAEGIYSTRGTVTVNGNPTFNVTAGSTTAYGAYAYGTIGAIGTGKYSGTININGGTFNVTSTQETAYGAYAGLISLNLTQKGTVPGDTIFGQHYMPGIISVTNGTFNVKAKTTAAYGIVVAAAKSESGFEGASTKSPTATITGGKFKVESAGDDNATAYAMNSSATPTNLKVQGGWYNTEKTNASSKPTIGGKYTAPTKDCNYHVLPLTGEDPYMYEVAEAYTITFKNGDDVLQSSAVKKGETPAYTGTPTKPEDEDYTYTFIGWDPEIAAVSAAATYTAQFNQVEKEVGIKLDIVEWTSNGNETGTLTLNLNGIPAAGWPYTINGIEYNKEKRAADRTLTIPYSGSADTKLTITVKDKDNKTYSRYKYIIPHIYGGETAELAETNSPARVIVVNSGTLTVTGNVTVDAIYVRPEAELVVNSGVKLTVNSLMLRTTPWKAASLDNNGTIVVSDQAYYTRIIADNSKYFQFAIPLASDVKNVRLSNNSKCTYNTSWMLKSYNEESRAKNGAVNTETISNWKLLEPDGEGHATILGSVGYEMFSNTPYYREYYFPVKLPETEATVVGVSYHLEEAGEKHAGWNALCSPLMRKYPQAHGEPDERLKISLLNPDGTYQQTAPDIIYPAVPFYYQATHNGKIYFNSSAMVFNAPRRAWDAYVPTQWLQLAIRNIKGDKLDETSIYAHPEKFAPEYETGYDVAKQSLTGGKALIYSELPCGKLAFAAVPDSLAEQRIPLTIYAATQEEYVFSLAENNYLGRLQHVLLHDTQNGLVIDLLERDYATEINAGTNAGRFYIQCVFAAEAPAVTTGVNSVESNDDAPQKIMYKNKVYIIYQGRVYDMTGRQCELK